MGLMSGHPHSSSASFKILASTMRSAISLIFLFPKYIITVRPLDRKFSYAIMCKKVLLDLAILKVIEMSVFEFDGLTSFEYVCQKWHFGFCCWSDIAKSNYWKCDFSMSPKDIGVLAWLIKSTVLVSVGCTAPVQDVWRPRRQSGRTRAADWKALAGGRPSTPRGLPLHRSRGEKWLRILSITSDR